MGLNYSKIYNNDIPIEDNGFFNGIQITNTTHAKRSELKNRLDEFCTFSWRGYDAFENFGAFIVNKNDLKFYNGSNFSNKYTSPQFETAAGQLTGVSFQIQKITFTIGIYWISEEHYRQLIYWLHPYEINTLQFGFDPQYYYQVKLAGREDSTRTVVGYEVVNGENVKQYYSEIKLTFEVQGPNCAYLAAPYAYEVGDLSVDNAIAMIPATLQTGSSFKKSDLDFPITSSIDLGLQQSAELNTTNRWQFLDAPSTIPTLDVRHVELTLTTDLLEQSFITHGIVSQNNSIIFVDNDANEIDYFSVTTDDMIGWCYWDEDAGEYIQLTQPPIIQWNDISNLDDETKEACLDFLQVTATLLPVPLENYALRCSFYADYTFDEVRYNNGEYIPTGESINQTLPLYSVILQHLTWTMESDQVDPYHYHINYTSDDGLVFMSAGDSEYFLLTNMTTAAQGQRLVQGLESNSFFVSGKFEDPRFDLRNLQFHWELELYDTNGNARAIEANNNTLSTVQSGNYKGLITINPDTTYIAARGRTNLI